VAGSPAEAVAQTVANGFASLESLPWPYVQLTTAQDAQVDEDLNQLTAEQVRFQKFVQKRSNADGLTKQGVVG
jgi:nicotinamidase-related amidase